MTLQEFLTNILPIIQSVVSILGIIGIYLLWVQIKQTNKWNKINTQHSLLNDLPNEDQEKRFHEIYMRYRGQEDVLSKSQVQNIFDNLDDFVCVKSVLNKYEHLCGAINSGSIDDHYAYAIHSARITHVFRWFENFVNFMRTIRNDDEIYLELEKVVSRWLAKSEKESQIVKQNIQDMKLKRGV